VQKGLVRSMRRRGGGGGIFLVFYIHTNTTHTISITHEAPPHTQLIVGIFFCSFNIDQVGCGKIFSFVVHQLWVGLCCAHIEKIL